MENIQSLSHTKWDCKYHVVFPSEVSQKSSLRADKEASG
jgi:hypothetical protein